MQAARADRQSLLLNADYTPIHVISWQDAVRLLLREKADLVVEYARSVLHTVSSSSPWPAVLRLKRYVSAHARTRFNRQNVLARDDYRCAYCGVRPQNADGGPDLRELTLDHVIPRAQSHVADDGGSRVRLPDGREVPVTCWENVVTCCAACNARKADRTPSQANLRLRSWPRPPSPADILRMNLRKYRIPTEWTEFLPGGARGWAGYWTVELSD